MSWYMHRLGLWFHALDRDLGGVDIRSIDLHTVRRDRPLNPNIRSIQRLDVSVIEHLYSCDMANTLLVFFRVELGLVRRHVLRRSISGEMGAS